MWFWRQIASLFQRLQTMADELIWQESTQSESMVSGNSVGIEPQPQDVDNRPIGRCYPEVVAVQNLVKQLRSIHAALGDAIARLGDCRAAARMPKAAADASVTNALIGALGNVIDGFDEDLAALTDCPACKQPADETKAE